jgi:putative MATE family efflux protein
MIARIELTSGTITNRLFRLSMPIILSMLMFTIYFLADLYFVGRLGPDAVAAVSISGNVFFIILGLSLIIGTGGMALIAQAFGRKDYSGAAKIFQQSILLGGFIGLVATLLGLSIAYPYIKFFGGVGQSLKWGIEYFHVFSISFFFLLLLHVIGSCYRGMGDTRTPMMIILQSISLNIILDPILIFGLLGFPQLGVRGAAIASLVSQFYSIGIYVYLIFVKGHHVKIQGPWRFDFRIISKSLSIGLPSGLTYFFLALNMLVTYRVVGGFGTEALASLGIGYRIIQTIYLPVVAVSSAMAAVVGQNFGASHYERIRTTLWVGWVFCAGIMVLGTILCWAIPASLMGIFSNDRQVIQYGVIYLSITALGNIVVGTIMTVSAVFQGLGKTYPTLIGAVIDNAVFIVLVLYALRVLGWGIEAVWWMKVFSASLEMVINSLWLRWDLRRVRRILS